MFADVYVGIVNLSPFSYVWELRVRGVDLWPHENYDPQTSANNIGLVYLYYAIPQNDYTVMISLPTRAVASENLDGKTGTIIGFGRNSVKSDGASILLRWVEVPIIGNDVCEQTFGTRILESNICAEIKSGKSSCYGLLN